MSSFSCVQTKPNLLGALYASYEPCMQDIYARTVSPPEIQMRSEAHITEAQRPRSGVSNRKDWRAALLVQNFPLA